MADIIVELATRIAVLEGRTSANKPDTGNLISGSWIVEMARMIATHFNDEELRELCLQLSLDYESLGGDGKSARAQRLVAYMDRRGRSVELIGVLDELRDHVAWPQM